MKENSCSRKTSTSKIWMNAASKLIKERKTGIHPSDVFVKDGDVGIERFGSRLANPYLSLLNGWWNLMVWIWLLPNEFRNKNCNHKGLGIYYLLSAFIFGISGTLISVLIRIELYSTGNRIISPENQNFYNISITLHGFIMSSRLHPKLA